MTGCTALVLAAGRGERMRPLTEGRAKPTLPVLGRTMLERIAAVLAAQGVATLAANAFHRPESVRDAAGCAASALGLPPFTIFEEPQLMGSAGSMAAPSSLLARAGSFLLYNGDTLLTPPVDALFAAAAGAGRVGALLVRPGRTAGYGGLVLRDGLVAGRFQPREEPDPRAGAAATYLGVAVLTSEVLPRVPPDRPSELFRDVLLPLLAEGRTLAAVEHAGAWLEFTDPRSYLRTLVRRLHAGRAAGAADLPGGAARLRLAPDGVIFAAEGAVIEAGAIVEGAVVLERGARVRRGARVSNTVVLEDADVAWGALLHDVVVDRGVCVPAGTSASRGVIVSTPGGDHVVQPFAS